MIIRVIYCFGRYFNGVFILNLIVGNFLLMKVPQIILNL